MPNLSQLKRQKLIEFINKIKDEHSGDDEALSALCAIENELNGKKYGLVWEEHAEHAELQMRTHIPVFTELKERKICLAPGKPYNFLLEGDNLHSLYLLEKTHKGKIDVIYIDPPYNTGNSFTYDDKMVGDEDFYKHSKWLSFMHARLTIAHRILSEKGVIFISINDFEGAQLKLLCDHIFGETNFLGQLTWESTTQPTNAGKAKFSLQKKVESIFCYAKNKQVKPDFILTEIDGGLSYPHKGKYGACRFEIIEKSDAGSYRRETMKFPILGLYPREGKRWQIGEETARELERQDKIEIVDGIVKRAVYPEDELDKKKFVPFWSHITAKEVGTAQTGKDELNGILGRAVGFDTVKPVNLIKSLLSHFPNDCTVLDFFAGSATTAQAVLELNRDGGDRRFILCTNNDGNICSDIAYPRIYALITGKRMDGTRYSDGFLANLKYFKTEFAARDCESLSDELLKHITEMIELERGENVNGDKYKVILTDEEADELQERWREFPDLKGIFISGGVLLTGEQEELFGSKELCFIPDRYFRFELKEEVNV